MCHVYLQVGYINSITYFGISVQYATALQKNYFYFIV